MRILVCDDDREIVDAIEIYLKSANYEVVKAYNGLEAITAIENEPQIHLIIMDVMMPKLDGIAATLKIRSADNRNSVPIIMLSAKSEDTDKILGLQMGADDYVTKPFNPLELLARVNSQLRRYTELGSAGNIVGGNPGVYQSGGLLIDDNCKTVSVDSNEVKLTPMQYKILLLLLRNKGRVFSINEIYEAVWNEDSFNAENIIAVHIRNIREKIEINPKEPKYLKVVWGIGYKVEAI